MKTILTPNDEDDDEVETNTGVFFWINKHGFPLDNKTWERMWDHAIKRHPQCNNVINNIRKSTNNLPNVPIPVWTIKAQMSLEKKIPAVQKYIESFDYNYTGTQFFDIKKNRPLCGLMETAKEIIHESLPIKCLEAVILAVYLTNGFRRVERFAISFNSLFQDITYRHVVLGIYCNGYYGALGLSRRKELMFKPLVFQSLYDLIMNFQDSYKKYCHKLLKVRIGLPINHNPYSYDYIIWRAIVLNIIKLDTEETEKRIEKHSRVIRKSRSGDQVLSVNTALIRTTVRLCCEGKKKCSCKQKVKTKDSSESLSPIFIDPNNKSIFLSDSLTGSKEKTFPTDFNYKLNMKRK